MNESYYPCLESGPWQALLRLSFRPIEFGHWNIEVGGGVYIYMKYQPESELVKIGQAGVRISGPSISINVLWDASDFHCSIDVKSYQTVASFNE